MAGPVFIHGGHTCGKSTFVAEMVRSGASVVDTDDLLHRSGYTLGGTWSPSYIQWSDIIGLVQREAAASDVVVSNIYDLPVPYDLSYMRPPFDAVRQAFLRNPRGLDAQAITSLAVQWLTTPHPSNPAVKRILLADSEYITRARVESDLGQPLIGPTSRRGW
jgi:hypothetical protein